MVQLKVINISAMGRSFTGIPFASSPINDLRWMPPIEPSSWNTVLETKQLPPQCPQDCDDDDTTYWCSPTTSEDCLYLNVWTPLNVTNTSLLPVLCWIYGGGYTVGYSAGILKNGTIMANMSNVIVVSMNYRVGATGFYYDESLDILGNFGYLDQVFAIEWIYNNIIEFGGDPTKITIYGESAGGHSVGLHLLNKSAIFRGAIMESMFGGWPMMPTDYWNSGQSDAFSTVLGCNTNESKSKQLQCLKDISWKRIVKDQGNFDWTPTVNTTLFPLDIIWAFQKGEFNQNIPFIIGNNLGEWYAFIAGTTFVSYDNLRGQLEAILGPNDTQSVLLFYNCTDKPVGYNFLNETAEIFTTAYVKCPERNITASQAIYGNQNGIYSYFYHWAHVSSFDLIETHNQLCLYATCHTTEIPYVFNDNLSSIGMTFTKQEELLAKQFQIYWSNIGI